MNSTITEIILAILGGLVLFLFAIKSLSDTIKKAVGDGAQKWILKFTSNTFTGILTGIVATILLDSSSAVIIIAIVLINAELLSFRRAMGIVLGANIGTTFSSQIIAMDVGKYSPILLLAGFILAMVSSSPRLSNTGKILLYFGILFFGLFTMEKAVSPLRDDPSFVEILGKMDNPIQGSLTGALVTLIIQSSSATVGMAIILAKKGLLSLAGGMAIMLGAELGTVSDTLLATINGTRQALKTGLFHLFFNLITIIIGLILFQPFVEMIQYLSERSGASIQQSVANAHIIFNVSGVVLMVWFIPVFEKALNRMLPEETQR
jgi:phosphate:Na+ symporter